MSFLVDLEQSLPSVSHKHKQIQLPQNPQWSAPSQCLAEIFKCVFVCVCNLSQWWQHWLAVKWRVVKWHYGSWSLMSLLTKRNVGWETYTTISNRHNPHTLTDTQGHTFTEPQGSKTPFTDNYGVHYAEHWGHQGPLSSVVLTSLSNLPGSLPLSMPPAVPRCSWQYTSVTMTSILLRFPLPRRRCAGMWWICARSQGKQTATCLRCGVDLVSDNASLPSVIHPHTMQNMSYSVTSCFVCGIWLYPKRQESVCRRLFVFFL